MIGGRGKGDDVPALDLSELLAEARDNCRRSV